MSDGTTKNTMEKILKAPEAEAPETVESTDATPEVTPEETEATEEEVAEDISSTTETDYETLLEDEKKRGKPDPEKAKERFVKKRAEEEEYEEEVDDEDKPLTRREAREFVAQQSHQILVESNAERINELSESVSDSPAQAAYIREIHKNRVFPAGMSLKEQIAEAHAIADYKRVQSKASEMAKTIKSQETASRDTATTHRDPQVGLAPKLDADMKQSLNRAGYSFNNKTRQYEKTLPNGKMLVTPDGKNPKLV